jgi:flap endonuclease-1
VGRRKLPGKQVWVDAQPEEIDLGASLDHAGCDPRRCGVKGAGTPDPGYQHEPLSREQLIDVALLVGTDFHPGIDGIGPKKAVALVKKEGTLEALLDRLAANPASAASAVERSLLEQHEALAERDAVRRIFLEPAHAPVRVEDLEMRMPDAPTVRKLMVETHGFSPERVDTALERFGAARRKLGQRTLF